MIDDVKVSSLLPGTVKGDPDSSTRSIRFLLIEGMVPAKRRVALCIRKRSGPVFEQTLHGLCRMLVIAEPPFPEIVEDIT